MNRGDDESSELQSILGSISEAEFFAHYWEQYPLHVSRNDATHFADLLSLEHIENMLSTQALYFPSVQLSRRSEPVAIGEYTDEDRRILPFRLIECHREGATVVISQAHDKLLSLANFRRRMQSALAMRCQTNVYLSPPARQGFHAHYDSHDVFILQVAGSKVFNFYNGGVKLPYSHEDFVYERHACGALQESILLEPGDSLYIPRGIMHDAVAQENSSLHITLGVYAVTMREVLLEMAQQCSEQNVAFRKSVPRHWVRGSRADIFSQQSFLQELLFESFTEAHLRQALGNILDSVALDSLPDCRGMLHQSNANALAVGAAHAQSNARPALLPTATVCLKRHLLLNVERCGKVVHCRTHSQVLQFADPFGAAFEQLLDSERVPLANIRGSDEQERQAICQRLLHANLLEVVD